MSILTDWNNEPKQWLIAQNLEAKNLLSNPLLEKDIWRTIEDLGLKVNQHNKTLTINFERIEQDWLKLLAKLYILVMSQRNYSAMTLNNDICYLAKFSRFINSEHIFNPEEQDSWQLFENFDYYLKSSINDKTKKKLSKRTIKLIYVSMKRFFNLCRRENWINIDTYWFKNRIKYSQSQNNNINYIPEEVWQQLEKHLHSFPEPMQRMVLIIRSTGLRIGELLSLPFDCLRKRNKQWRLRFLTEKYEVEDELPICEELVAIIREQQEYNRQHFPSNYSYLFGSNGSSHHHYKPVPRVMSGTTFNARLNKLATKHNICNQKGEIWKFRSHQFRKTVATIMTNAGVRDLIIQKYLRHRSPDMQNYYKHLLKQVIEDEYQELMKETKYVDSTGKIVATHKPNNPITELIRRKMYQITTQYGECHRPVLKSPCQTVNACWRCEHWLTSTDDLDDLKYDLQRVEAELEISRKLEMTRQEKGLSDDKKRLVIRIEGLEKSHEN